MLHRDCFIELAKDYEGRRVTAITHSSTGSSLLPGFRPARAALVAVLTSRVPGARMQDRSMRDCDDAA